MRYIAILLLSILFSCKQEPAHDNAEQLSPAKILDNDYNGDGSPDDAGVVLIKEAEGNPVEDGIPAEYAITFPDKKLPEISICCDAVVVPEGDLNGDGAAELSVFQAPMNGCVYTMSTYTFINGKWKLLFEPFMVPTGCDEISTEQLQSLVYKEGNKVYILETDVNDENFKKVAKEVKLY